MNICIFGASSNDIDQKYIDDVFHLGELMAENGHALVFGGGQRGLMGAAARGMKAKGGYVIGIAPVVFDDDTILFPGLDEKHITKNLTDRKEMMMALSDVFIAVPGGFGTYDELFEVLSNHQMGYHDKSVILLNTDGFYDTLWKFIGEAVDKGFIVGGNQDCCYIANSPEEALEIINKVVNI